MKIRFKQTGGIAGTTRICEVDTDSMSPSEAQELERLLTQSGVMAEDNVQPRSAADAFQYDLEVENGGNKTHAMLSDTSLDEHSTKLIQFLKGKATFVPRP
jgi:hypothetical protein